MSTEKKFLRTEKGFDPRLHVKQMRGDTVNGWAYAPEILENGCPKIEDGHVVLVPQMYLDGDAYREWWWTEFPDGRTELVRHTTSDTLEIFEVKLYLNKGDSYPVTSGWGECVRDLSSQYEAIGTAITKAFKNAMRNLGCGVDLQYSDYKDRLPEYVENVTGGEYKVVEVVPQEIPVIPESTKNTSGTSSKDSVNTEEISAAIEKRKLAMQKALEELPHENVAKKPSEKEDSVVTESTPNSDDVIFQLSADADERIATKVAEYEIIGVPLSEISKRKNGKLILKRFLTPKYKPAVPEDVLAGIQELFKEG